MVAAPLGIGPDVAVIRVFFVVSSGMAAFVCFINGSSLEY